MVCTQSIYAVRSMKVPCRPMYKNAAIWDDGLAVSIINGQSYVGDPIGKAKRVATGKKCRGLSVLPEKERGETRFPSLLLQAKKT